MNLGVLECPDHDLTLAQELSGSNSSFITRGGKRRTKKGPHFPEKENEDASIF